MCVTIAIEALCSAARDEEKIAKVAAYVQQDFDDLFKDFQGFCKCTDIITQLMLMHWRIAHKLGIDNIINNIVIMQLIFVISSMDLELMGMHTKLLKV